MPIAAIVGVAALIANFGMPDRQDTTCGIPQRFPKVFAAYQKVTPAPRNYLMHDMAGVGSPLEQITSGPDAITVGAFCEQHSCIDHHAEIAFTRGSQRILLLSVTIAGREAFRQAEEPLAVEVTQWLRRIGNGNAPYNPC